MDKLTLCPIYFTEIQRYVFVSFVYLDTRVEYSALFKCYTIEDILCQLWGGGRIKLSSTWPSKKLIFLAWPSEQGIYMYGGGMGGEVVDQQEVDNKLSKAKIIPYPTAGNRTWDFVLRFCVLSVRSFPVKTSPFFLSRVLPFFFISC